VEYLGVLCASLVLKRPLSGYYVTNITDSWAPFTAVIEMTALVDPAQFGGARWSTCPSTWPPTMPISIRPTK